MSSPESKKRFTVQNTLIFMAVLSFISALILSLMAVALKEPQTKARELDRSKEMLIAAQLLNHQGILKIDGKEVHATNNEIIQAYNDRIKPYVVNDKGELSTFEKEGIDYSSYLENFKKVGYFTQSWKLVYKILPNEGWIIPINGYGLWDAMYGYLALKPDGNTVIGISWYDQKETPGLGANITEESWQKQFPGKVIFQPSPDGKTDFKTAPVGITVVRGKVSEVIGPQPKAKNAVDGMAGATLTGNGVTAAYSAVLSGYRPFLLKLQGESEKNGTK